MIAPQAQPAEPPGPGADLGSGFVPGHGSWYAALLAGLLPVLLLGFAASAVADRLSFAGWGLATGALYLALLRWGWGAGWGRWLLAGRVLLLLAGAAAVYARLVAAAGEDLDLGLLALAPALHFAAWSRPATYLLAAVALAAGGTLGLLLGHLSAGGTR